MLGRDNVVWEENGVLLQGTISPEQCELCVLWIVIVVVVVFVAKRTNME